MVTGTGNQVCGNAARAYCDMHMAEYLYTTEDFDSAGACDDAFPGHFCSLIRTFNRDMRRDEATDDEVSEDLGVSGGADYEFHSKNC